MKINEIIHDELKNVLSEGFVFKDDKFIFNQNVKNVTFNNYSSFTTEYDPDITESDLWVNWNISFWLNDNGVDNFIVEIAKVTGQYVLELYNKQTDKQEQSITKDISELPWKFVVDDAALTKGGALYINALIFDFNNNTCTVTF